MTEFIPSHAVYTPMESSSYAMQSIEKMRNKKMRGLNLNIAEIRDYFAPLMPGQVASVIAQTSQYKSGFLHFWERQAALQLMQENRLDESIIHVSVEEIIEEQMFVELARETGDKIGDLSRGQVQDWSKLEQAAVRVGQIPIYRIGESIARAEDMPKLYLSNMIRSLVDLVDGKVSGEKIKPAAIFFDYLQAFPIDPEIQATDDVRSQRRLQVRSDLYRLRQAAAYFDCPVIVAIQAKQFLDGAAGKDWQMPGIYDGEESSSIAQRSDRIIQLWMPKQTHPIGYEINHKAVSFTVTENIIVLKVGKQRGGLPSGRSWVLNVDFTKNEIAPQKLQANSKPVKLWYDD